MKRIALLAAALGSALLPGACRNFDVIERRSEPLRALSVTRPELAVLRPTVAPGAGESFWIYPALPLVWLTQIIAFKVPSAAPTPQESLDDLRVAIAAQFDSVGLHAVALDRVDAAVSLDRDLRRFGADYVLHTEIRDWSRDYWILHAQVVVEIGFRLVRLADGVEVWDGTVTARHQAGLLQMANYASGFFSAPVAGIPVGQLSAITGPPSKLRGDAYGEIVRDAARLLALHVSPDASTGDTCPCESCTERLREPDADVRRAAILGWSDAPYGVGDAIEVAAVVPEGMSAIFDVGVVHTGLVMVEQGRVPGVDDPLVLLRGTYVVQPSDAAAGKQVVRVRAIGRASTSAPRELDTTPVVIAP